MNTLSKFVRPVRHSAAVWLVIWLALVVPATWAASLTAIDHASLPGNRVEIRLTLSEPVSAAPLRA